MDPGRGAITLGLFLVNTSDENGEIGQITDWSQRKLVSHISSKLIGRSK